MVISRKASELTGDRKLYHRSGKLYHRAWRAPFNYSFERYYFERQKLICSKTPLFLCFHRTCGRFSFVGVDCWHHAFAHIGPWICPCTIKTPSICFGKQFSLRLPPCFYMDHHTYQRAKNETFE